MFCFSNLSGKLVFSCSLFGELFLRYTTFQVHSELFPNIPQLLFTENLRNVSYSNVLDN